MGTSEWCSNRCSPHPLYVDFLSITKCVQRVMSKAEVPYTWYANEKVGCLFLLQSPWLTLTFAFAPMGTGTYLFIVCIHIHIRTYGSITVCLRAFPFFISFACRIPCIRNLSLILTHDPNCSISKQRLVRGILEFSFQLSTIPKDNDCLLDPYLHI